MSLASVKISSLERYWTLRKSISALKVGHLVGNLLHALFEGVIPGPESIAADFVGLIEIVELVHLALGFCASVSKDSSNPCFCLRISSACSKYAVMSDEEKKK